MMQTPYNTSTQGQYCHSCSMFHDHSQSCCYNNNNSNSNAGVYQHNGEGYYSASVVDCTLSLGTPSTRLCEEDEKRRRTASYGASSSISNFWELLHTKNNNTKTTPSFDAPSFSTSNPIKPILGCSSSYGGGDSLLARRCANCDTTSTPLWRNGPRGPKSLCNACGIRFKKEERRTTTASGNAVVGASPVAGVPYGHHNAGYNINPGNNNSGTSWAHHHTTQRAPCNYPANEIRFMDDYGSTGANNGDSDGSHGGVPFLSWRLNVADRASLVHDFTI
ncbi:GATA transcription factor 18 [Raphanus sativus]|uniref:GATA transcription factor 18-like n=1 Tax=Raphanus sativus TaxID=3726 RepID=A0A9W3CM45_RAPSA|nr:GATA transcription factor 18-like [Raphanus sativus]KAJ4872637.1 GATA transcription factor 18 [Raphanus sativus]